MSAMGDWYQTYEQLSNEQFTVLGLHDQTEDRVVAIVATAHLEIMLYRLLKVALPAADAALRKALFDDVSGNGPLRTLGNRAMMARALGLLENVYYKEIRLIAKVRNIFAHQMSISSFDHPSISGLVKKLDESREETHLGPPRSIKELFIARVIGISMRLEGECARTIQSGMFHSNPNADN